MIPVAKPWLSKLEKKYLEEAYESGWISPQGSHVERFEEKFAEYIGVEYAFTTTTGTSALHLALISQGIGEGDEVIVPDLTYIACRNIVERTGAKPVLVDVCKDDFTIDIEDVREKISSDTRAIMPVHLYGAPCQMEELEKIANLEGISIIEDCAEAHGAEHRGQKTGSLGDVGCFSFYGNKTMTTGQGGMIVTDDEELAEKVSKYRGDGSVSGKDYFHDHKGYNYQMTNLQAALGLAQLERIDIILEKKKEINSLYRNNLSDIPARFQKERTGNRNIYWMNAVVFEDKDLREKVEKNLEKNEVETRRFFYPIHRQPIYNGKEFKKGSKSLELYRKGLILPSGPSIEREELEQVCETIKEVFD